jgi:AmmeMemoRadiSam system protein A
VKPNRGFRSATPIVRIRVSANPMMQVTCSPESLNPEVRLHLLRLARRTATNHLAGRSSPSDPNPAIAGRFGGAFTTFWAGEKRLRGCIGSFEPTERLDRTVQEVTRASLKDPRFAASPITLSELPSLRIELSILSHLQPTKDPLSLQPGLHGILIRVRGRSGCFLPHVATEHSWSAREFVENCCVLKADLARDGWRDPAAELFLFTADVFSESARPGQVSRASHRAR